MTTEPIQVLLVDDHAVVRRGLSAFLATYPEITVVGEASSGAEGIVLAAPLLPDVVLMDLLMTGMDGIEATLHLQDRTQAALLALRERLVPLDEKE